MCVAGSRVSPLEDLGGAEGFMKQQQRFIDGEMTIRILEICVALHQLYEQIREHLGCFETTIFNVSSIALL